jgi:hypothetical protein
VSIEHAGPQPESDRQAHQVGAGPKIVVTALDLKQPAREALAQRLGPGHVVVDIRDAGNSADIVLIPPASPQLVGALRAMFPDAQLLITEFTDDEFGVDFSGPVGRSVGSGVDGYFVVPTLDELATVTRQAGSHPTTRGRLTTGPSTSRQVGAASQPALQLDPVDGERPESVRVDLESWATETGIDAGALIQLAWPMLMQLRQQIGITIVGLDEPEWIDRAQAAGIDVDRQR